MVSRDEDIEGMLKLLKPKKGQKAVDIGSGDGRLVILLAQKGLVVDGYEINPWLVFRSNRDIQRLGLQKRAHVYWKSMWEADFSDYDIVTIYAIKHIMGKLEKKLQKELPKGAKVASNYFTFPSWKPIKEDQRIHLYLQQ